MLKNYLKIAIRRISKQKVETAISIGGLAIGIACCLLLMLSVRFEFTFDNFHEKKDRIFRVYTHTERGYGSKQPIPIAPAMDSTFPQIKNTVRFHESSVKMKRGEKFISEGVSLVDPDFFQVFSFPLQSSDKDEVLSDPNSIVLSQSMARKYFGDQRAVGKSMELEMQGEEYTYRVTGVVEEIPANSSITFDFLLSFQSLSRTLSTERYEAFKNSSIWPVSIWVLLKPGASEASVEKKFPDFIQTKNLYMDQSSTMGLQPLENVYLSQRFDHGYVKHTNLHYTLILGLIALIILSIAGMNFMSLTLSRITDREHEIGIRKASGADRWQLAFQILGEIMITSTIALIVGLVLTEWAAPWFQEIIQKPVHPHLLSDPIAWLLILAVIPLLTVVTGWYPAYVIASRKAIGLFRSRSTAEQIPRFVKGLIVVQFALTFAFLIGTFVMRNQIDYLFNKDLGYSPEEVVAIDFHVQSEALLDQAQMYRQEVNRIPQVQDASILSSNYRYQRPYFGGLIGWQTRTSLDGLRVVYNEQVDGNYVKTMGLNLIAGRTFDRDRPSDIERGIIVNKEMVRRLGMEEPIGKTLKSTGNRHFGVLDGKKIIGVIENFHFQPLYNQLGPLFLEHLESDSDPRVGTILVKTSEENRSKVVKALRDTWDEMLPEQSFNYAYLEDLLAKQYTIQERWRYIMEVASSIAIVLACFGLFGLASLTTRRRTREIGIRKVLGARTGLIVWLLNKDFLKYVLTGFVIAVPIAWYIMHKWLQIFAYKIEMGPSYFLIGGGIGLLIALATVSWHSVQTALTNPAESIRSE